MAMNDLAMQGNGEGVCIGGERYGEFGAGNDRRGNGDGGEECFESAD